MARTTFTFRLQRLLELRELREQQEQQRLVALRLALQQQEARLAALVQEEQELLERMTVAPGERFDVEERQLCERWLTVKRNEQRQQQERVAKAAQQVQDQAAVVRQAGIDVKALERLKERKLEEHRVEELRTQAIFLDDIAGQQFIRQQAAEAQRADELPSTTGDPV